MVDRLEKYDQSKALDELVQLTEELGLYDDVTASETEEAPPAQDEPERPSEGNTGLEDGAFIHTFPANDFLTTEQHQYYISKTEAVAKECGHDIRGGAFRVSTGFSDQWEYRVWVK